MILFRGGIGAEAVRELLANIDLDELSKELRDELKLLQVRKKLKS